MSQAVMPIVRKADDRGRVKIDWLQSYHTFSFGSYHDPNFMGFRSLRVINDDVVSPGGGFATHGHRDMEIITYVLAGALAHEDSLGTGAVIYPGEVQRMSAGTGIQHSEFNNSDTAPVHLLQIWILPDILNLPPSYEQKSFPTAEKQGKLRLVGARDGRDGAVTIHQDANMYVGLLGADDKISYQVPPDRYVWLHVATGEISIDSNIFKAGDAIAYAGESSIELSSPSQAEILLFDLA
jgi:quercetin 2,3-dioxygenase